MYDNLLYKALEVSPTTVSAFDYLKDPLDINSMRALVRMYDLIPLMAQIILNEITDRIKDENKGVLIQALKKDYPRISNWLSENSRQVIQRYDKDSQEGYETMIGELHLQNKIMDELARKVLPHISKDTRKLWQGKPGFYDLMSRGRIVKFVKKYISIVTIIEEVINTESVIEFKKNVIDRCIPMGQLEVGQEFMFPFKEHEMDADGCAFTYLGLFEENEGEHGKEVVCHYRKLSDSIHIYYIERNALRAVLPLTPSF